MTKVNARCFQLQILKNILGSYQCYNRGFNNDLITNGISNYTVNRRLKKY